MNPERVHKNNPPPLFLKANLSHHVLLRCHSQEEANLPDCVFFSFSFHFCYHSQEEANWNSGPNTQFYRMAQYFIDQGDDNTLFFYMEGDLTIVHLYHLQLQTSLYHFT
jgi:hypothetical protein